MRPRLVTALCLLVVLVMWSVPAQADDPEVEVVATFDASLGHLPEGISVARSGDIFVSLGPPFFVGGGYGEIRRISPSGRMATLFQFPSGPAPAGVLADGRDGVYFAVPDLSQTAGGVYRFTRQRGVERIGGTEQMLVANGLARDARRGLYITDSVLGEIWKLEAGATVAATWLSHPLLAGCGQPGANGVAIWEGDVYVANTDKGILVRVPVRADGTAGEPEIVAGDDDCDPTDELWGIDGIAIDDQGTVYALLVLTHELVRIDLDDGDVAVVLTEADGLWNPASLAFGVGRDRGTLYLTNYAVVPPEPANSLGPAVLKVRVRP